MTPEHSPISPTAKLVAYLRAGSGIPYCDAIAKACRAEQATASFFGDNHFEMESRRALVELRFRSLNAMIERLGHKQVLELGAGLSPRGLLLTEDPSMNFLETDLAPVVEEKLSILFSLTDHVNRPNYRLCPVNALDFEAIKGLGGQLKFQNVTVVHEGVMQHMNLVEKGMLTNHIRAVIKSFGGAWVTPDVFTLEHLERFYSTGEQAKLTDIVAQQTQRDIRANCFPDWAWAQTFFMMRMLTVERFKQIDLVPEMRQSITDPKILERMAFEELWVMRT